jgi:hypothetical protein
LAIVISLLNTSEEATVPVRRRRGRFYHGVCLATALASDGRVAGSYQSQLDAAWREIDGAMRLVPGVTAPGLSGFCIASVASDQLFSADLMGVGLAFDTQRRRRKKTPEDLTYSALP